MNSIKFILSKTLLILALLGFYASAEPVTPFEEEIQKASKRYGVPSALIKGVIRQESAFNPTAESHAGAKGLMQLMPPTAREMGVVDPFDPVQNINGGTKYITVVLKWQKGDICLALASYNWGMGNVDKLEKKYGTSDCEALLPFMPKEPREYVVKVLSYAESYGFNLEEFNLEDLATAAGAPPPPVGEDGMVLAENQTKFVAFYEKLFERVEHTLSIMNETGFVRMRDAIKPTLNSLLLIWITLNLFAVNRGKLNVYDFLNKVIRVAFILALAINFDTFKTFISNPLTEADEYFISMVFPEAKNTGESLDLLAARVTLSVTHLEQTALTFADEVMVRLLYVIFSWFTSFFSTMYMFADVGIFVCTLLAPLFIILAIFDTTRNMTLRWVQLFIFFTLVKILITIILYFMYGIGLDDVDSSSFTGIIGYIAPLVMLGVAFAMLIDVARFAVALAGGYDVMFPGLIGKQMGKHLNRRAKRKQKRKARRGSVYYGTKLNQAAKIGNAKAKEAYAKAKESLKNYSYA